MHAVVAEAGIGWDPKNWDGATFDSAALDHGSEGEVFAEVQAVRGRKLAGEPDGCPVRPDAVEDFTQPEIHGNWK